MKAYKHTQGFTIIELMVAMALIAIIASIAIPTYQNYMVRVKWVKTIATTSALKLAIENCLNDKAGVLSLCDELTEDKIVAYGITQYLSANEDFKKIEILKDTSEIQITGDQPLDNCILKISPEFNRGGGMIIWRYYMTTGSASVSAETCANYVKGAIVI